MDNTGRAICEAILSVYKDLERECDRLDVKVDRTVCHSSNRKIYDTIDEITKLTNQKIACINAKVIIDDALDTLPNTVEVRKYYLERCQRPPLWNERVGKQKEQLFEAILKKYKIQELLNFIMDSQWLMDEVRHQRNLLDKAEQKG